MTGEEMASAPSSHDLIIPSSFPLARSKQSRSALRLGRWRDQIHPRCGEVNGGRAGNGGEFEERGLCAHQGVDLQRAEIDVGLELSGGPMNLDMPGHRGAAGGVAKVIRRATGGQ